MSKRSTATRTLVAVSVAIAEIPLGKGSTGPRYGPPWAWRHDGERFEEAETFV
jgi:hypothetical protein